MRSAARQQALATRGGFNIAKYMQRYYAKTGIRNEKEKVMLTQKQFITHMEAKGKSAAWAKEEWERRKAAPENVWKKGVDADTKLPTIAAYGDDREVDFDEKGIEDGVELEGKSKKNPKKKDVDSWLANLGEDGLDTEAAHNLLRANNFVDAAIDFRADETTDFKPSVWNKRKAEKVECIETEPEDGTEGDEATEDAASSNKAKKFKFMDLDGKKGAARQKLDRALDGLTDSMDDAVNSGNEAIHECKNMEAHDKAVFGPRLTSLNQRVLPLLAVSEGGETWKKYRDNMNASIESDEKNISKLPIPKMYFDRLVDRAALKASITTLGEHAESEELLQVEVKKWENNCEAVSVLVQAVRSAVGYFNSAKNARDRHIDNRQKAQAKGSAKAKAEKPQTTSFGASKNAIFDINLAQHHPEVLRSEI